ncbi:hypothetical protein Cadr_000031108 [Camelus dromedarius]|uniref:Uncharacterized protein n=1 Tax=Camelus dromedarius TaxID=9838 RepID=A0A5N4C0E2_CAMDR|nr:hypothetical protein Cadr_000031108 [Camelus dromedarius]
MVGADCTAVKTAEGIKEGGKGLEKSRREGQKIREPGGLGAGPREREEQRWGGARLRNQLLHMSPHPSHTAFNWPKTLSCLDVTLGRTLRIEGSGKQEQGTQGEIQEDI